MREDERDTIVIVLYLYEQWVKNISYQLTKQKLMQHYILLVDKQNILKINIYDIWVVQLNTEMLVKSRLCNIKYECPK